MSQAGRGMAGLARQDFHKAKTMALDPVGGPARGRVVLILAAVLSLNGADTGTISATTGNLERAFHIGNTQIGLLLTIVALVGAVFTIPVGILTDRTNRTRLLAGSIAAWAAATALSGAATSYLWLLLARVFLGIVTATAGPTIASLTGDFFPAADRGRMYGLIISGELAGTGIGYVISGDISSLTTWRVAFWWLVIPSLALAWVVWRLPEPARGGIAPLEAGAEHLSAEPPGPPQPRSAAAGNDAGRAAGTGPADEQDLAGALVGQAGVQSQEELVLHSDPTDRPVWWAVRYVLRVRTNVVIIVASALGYFFFAGLRSFAILFATGHYGISKPTATALAVIIGGGAVVGVYTGGRVADRLLRQGHIRARVLVPAICLLALTPVLAPAVATSTLAIALPLLLAGGFLLGAVNPPLDAARLDIIHPRLWGRAEGVRTVLRSLGEAAAPLLFGYVSQYVFGSPGSSAATEGSGTGRASTGTSLEYTLLMFLIPLVIAGLLALLALRTYPRDVATAAASAQAINNDAQDADPGSAAG